MTDEQRMIFEAYVKSLGHNVTRERGRYCEGVVNSMEKTFMYGTRMRDEKIFAR